MRHRLNKAVNRLMNFAAAVIMLVWCVKWFGPGSGELRKGAMLQYGISVTGYLIAGALLCAGGYLIWRLLIHIYDKKYDR